MAPLSSPPPAGGASAVPVVHWAQSPRAVHLKVDAAEVDAKSVRVTVREGSNLTIEAKSKTTGHTYTVTLGLYGPVLPTPQKQVLSGSFSISLAKVVGPNNEVTEAEWPRLLADASADKRRIKVDWDRFVDGDEATEVEAEESASKERTELTAEWAALQARGAMPEGVAQAQEFVSIPQAERLRITYLLTYNLFVIVGVCLILFLAAQTCFLHYRGRDRFPEGSQTREFTPIEHLDHDGGFVNAFFHGLGSLHARVGTVAYIVQLLATLELVHAATGLIPGRILPSFLLNGGRDIILFGAIYAFDRTQNDWSVGALYVLWAFGDLIRFIFYLSQCVGASASVNARLIADAWLSPLILTPLREPSAVATLQTWRYTLPLFLMPFGFLTELAVVWASRDQAALVPLFGGAFNVAQLFAVYCFFGYLLGAPSLYLAVLSQRKAKVGGKRKKAKTTDAVAPPLPLRPSEKKEAKKAQ